MMQQSLFNYFAVRRSACVQEKLWNGGRAKLSLAQIANSLVKLADAKKNLTEKQYRDVRLLLSAYKERKEKTEYNWTRYEYVSMCIIRKFDTLAPYEKYCSGNKAVWNIVMKRLRKDQ